MPDSVEKIVNEMDEFSSNLSPSRGTKAQIESWVRRLRNVMPRAAEHRETVKLKSQDPAPEDLDQWNVAPDGSGISHKSLDRTGVFGDPPVDDNLDNDLIAQLKAFAEPMEGESGDRKERPGYYNLMADQGIALRQMISLGVMAIVKAIEGKE